MKKLITLILILFMVCPVWADSTNMMLARVARSKASGGVYDGPILGIDFDGNDDFINYGTMSSIYTNIENTLSISIWIKTSQTTNCGILGVSVSNRSSFIIVLNESPDGTDNQQGHIRILTHPGDTGDELEFGVAADCGITDGEWHHIVINCDPLNNNGSIYVDNTSKSITYTKQELEGDENYGEPSGYSVPFGCTYIFGTGNTNFSDFTACEFAIWTSDVLSSGEISTLYGNGSPTLGEPLNVSSATLNLYCPLNDVPNGESGSGDTFVDDKGSTDGTGDDGANNTGLQGITITIS